MALYRRLLCLAVAPSLFAGSLLAQGAATPTDANLVTAIDVSGSIKANDEHLELEGMAQALVDPRFLQAVARGYHGRIGFAVFTWADGEFVPLVPWLPISSKAEAARVAALLRAARPRPSMGYATRLPSNRRLWKTGHATDVSKALDHAIEVSASAPFVSQHTVINMCANGVDNVADWPSATRSRALDRDLIINGLVLGDREDSEEIAAWFREHVQAGPGSFVIEARAFDDIVDAMLAKFVMELASLAPAAAARAEVHAREGPS